MLVVTMAHIIVIAANVKYMPGENIMGYCHKDSIYLYMKEDAQCKCSMCRYTRTYVHTHPIQAYFPVNRSL